MNLGNFRITSITSREGSADVTLQALPTAEQEAAGVTTWDSAVTGGANAGTLTLNKVDPALLASVSVGQVYGLSVGAAFSA